MYLTQNEEFRIKAACDDIRHHMSTVQENIDKGFNPTGIHALKEIARKNEEIISVVADVKRKA